MTQLRSITHTASLVAASFLTLSASALAQSGEPKEGAEASPVTLKVGDRAPDFRPGTWLKGEPIAALAKGRIYVVEFWATWCGPCKASMPHISKLAKRYAGKIHFVGVDVLEEGEFEEIETKVADFMKTEGGAMEYLVCRDTADRAMQRTWLAAAGETGIPSTFIVDATGRLVWIGHPQGMDHVLEKVLDNTFDPFAEEKAAKAYRDAEQAVSNALQAKEWQKALDLARALKPTNGIGEIWKGFFEFQANLHLDEKAAASAFEKALKEDERGVIDFYATLVVREEGLAKAWYGRAVEFLSKRAKDDASTFSMLAKAQFKAGDAKSAVESQTKAIADLRARTPQILKDHPEAGEQIRGILAKEEAALQTYERAAKEEAKASRDK